MPLVTGMQSTSMTGAQPLLSRVEIGRSRRGRDRAILRGVVATVAVRLISVGASLLTLGIAARSMTKVQFGFIAAVVSLWMILTLLDLGLGGTLTTRVASAHGHDDLKAMRAHVRDALYALTVVGLVLAVAGGLSAFFLPWGRWLGAGLAPSTVTPAVVLMFVAAGASMPGVVGIATLTGRQRMATAQLTTAMGGIATVVAAIAAALLNLPPWAFVLAILGCPTLVSLGVTAWIVLVELPGVIAYDGFNPQRIASTVRISGYFAVMGASNAIAFGTGTLIVATVLGAGQAAAFTIASRMYAMLYAVISQSGAQLWPGLAEAIARRDFGWVHSRYRNSLVAVMLITSAASAGLVMFGRPIAQIWVGPGLVPSSSLLISLGGFTIALCGVTQAGTLPLATERVRPVAAICVANAIVGTVAAVGLTTAIGPAGAALGGLLSCVCILVPGIALISRSALHGLARLSPSTPDASAWQARPSPRSSTR